MVHHFSSKLSHFANGFRAPPHFTFTRNAFPANGTFTSNPVPVQGPFTSNSLGGPHSNQATGSGSGANAGSAGGSKWGAGKKTSAWTFQNQQRVVAQQSDALRTDDDEDKPSPKRRPKLLHSSSTSATPSLNRRAPNIVPPPVPLSAGEKVDTTVEGGSRISRDELQRMYAEAFFDGTKTPDVVEFEREADEVDLGLPESSVSRTGRRASVSRFILPTPHILEKSPVVSRRTLHTLADRPPTSHFPSPPLADVPRRRRNSTSAVPSSSPPIASSAPGDFFSYAVSGRPRQRNEVRPPSDAPRDGAAPRKIIHRRQSGSDVPPLEYFPSEAARNRHIQIVEARQTRNPKAVEEAIRSYRAYESDYTCASHDVALSALQETRIPGTELNEMLELYNQMFDHEMLRPTITAYRTVISALCYRDDEVLSAAAYAQKRERKLNLTFRARGFWHSGLDTKDDALNKQAAKDLAEKDYLGPALEVYRALGPKTMQELGIATLNRLVMAAVRREKLELASSLAALAGQRGLVPNAGTYTALLDMFKASKDVQGVQGAFEAFLADRKSGKVVSTVLGGTSRVRYGVRPVKRGHSVAPIYKEKRGEVTPPSTDELVWQHALTAYATLGEVAKAVSLVEEIISMREQKLRKAGYPSRLTSNMVYPVIRGLIGEGDFESARQWIDRVAARPEGLHDHFYSSVCYDLVDIEASEGSIDLLKHVFLAACQYAQPEEPIKISHFIATVDKLLAAANNETASISLRDQALDTVLHISAGYRQAVLDGKTGDIKNPIDMWGTGVLERLATTFAACSRYDDAVVFLLELADAVQVAMRQDGQYRTRARWSLVLYNPVAAVLGLKRGDQGKHAAMEGQLVRNANVTRPSTALVASVVDRAQRLRRHSKLSRCREHDFFLVDGYLREKEEAKGDIKQLDMNPYAWFSLISAYAAVAVAERHGQTPPIGFPGFEPIIDDFYASEVSLEVAKPEIFRPLIELLEQLKIEQGRLRAILNVLNPAIEDYFIRGKAQAEERTIAAPPKPASLVEATSPTPASDVVSQAESDVLSSALASGAGSFPTPPSTPPKYLSELPTPAPIEEPKIKIRLEASNRLDQLAGINHVEEAYHYAIEQSRKGIFAHPDAYGRIVEALGRKGNVPAAQELYLVAYHALGALSSRPEEQSAAWVMLEDRMIVGLSHAGSLEHVVAHRMRLIQGGSAPSADSYAAMILNMKDTTNDAAVALQLFEESRDRKSVV